MKVFGNSKHSEEKEFHFSVEDTYRPEEQMNMEQEAPAEKEYVEEESRVGGKGRSVGLFLGALCLFVCAIGMCMILITKSADLEPLPAIKATKPMEYVVDIEVPEESVMPAEYTAPVSENGSGLINFLIISVDDEESNMMMLASVNLVSKQASLLSIPRDTYITGNYTEPKLRNVYAASEESGRGIQALVEKSREMIGFWPDYYLVLDEDSVNEIFNQIGDIPFEVPSSPSYTDLESGEQSIDSHSAMQLFSCRNNYSRIETDSTAVQRDLLLLMFDKLFEQQDSAMEIADQLSAVMHTNLKASELAYLIYFLHDLELNDVYSNVLPGEVIEIEEDGKEYFQVNLEEAVKILNAFFNSTKTELTIYDLNFRQLAGDSGEGEYEDYRAYFDNKDDHHYTPTRPQNNDDDDDDNDETEPTEAPPPPTETIPVTPPDPIDPNA